LWYKLISEHFEGVDYNLWMLSILFIGCVFAVASLTTILEWFKDKYNE